MIENGVISSKSFNWKPHNNTRSKDRYVS